MLDSSRLLRGAGFHVELRLGDLTPLPPRSIAQALADAASGPSTRPGGGDGAAGITRPVASIDVEDALIADRKARRDLPDSPRPRSRRSLGSGSRPTPASGRSGAAGDSLATGRGHRAAKGLLV